jgi:hypothetical protein
MSDDTPRSTAGGFLLALGAILGAAVGLAKGQVTIGFLAGLSIGAVAAIAMWLRERGR